MEYLFVATTAINRSILHNKIIPQWRDWIFESRVTIIWFINIDTLNNLSENRNDTEINFQHMLTNYVNDLIILPRQYDNFLGACKKLSIAIKKYVDDKKINKNNIKIMWLEDDWSLETHNIKLADLCHYYNKMCHIDLSGIENNYIWALAPSIIGYTLWENIFYGAWIKETRNICPEKSVGEHYQNMYCYHDNTPNITIVMQHMNDCILSHLNTITRFDKSFLTSSDDYDMIVKNHNKYISNNNIFQNVPDDSPVFIKIYPKLAFDEGAKYLLQHNIVKQWGKRGVIIYTTPT